MSKTTKIILIIFSVLVISVGAWLYFKNKNTTDETTDTTDTETTDNTPIYHAPTAARYGYVISGDFIRSDASWLSLKIGTVIKGDRVDILGEKNEFFKIKKGSQVGWVYKSQISEQ